MKTAPRWPIWGGHIVSCAGVLSWDKSYGLNLYDTLCDLVEKGGIPLWKSVAHACRRRNKRWKEYYLVLVGQIEGRD